LQNFITLDVLKNDRKAEETETATVATAAGRKAMTAKQKLPN